MGESIKIVCGKGVSTKAWSKDASNDVDEKDIAFAESKGLLAKLAEVGGWDGEQFLDDAWILVTDALDEDLDWDPAVVAYATMPRKEDVMTKIDLVVTRHPALVDLLRERGLIDDTVQVVEHVTDPSTLDGKHVAGVLPLSLASRCASVTEIPLRLTPEDRGKELPLERLRAIAGEATTYIVDAAKPTKVRARFYEYTIDGCYEKAEAHDFDLVAPTARHAETAVAALAAVPYCDIEVLRPLKAVEGIPSSDLREEAYSLIERAKYDEIVVYRTCTWVADGHVDRAVFIEARGGRGLAECAGAFDEGDHHPHRTVLFHRRDRR